MYKHLLYPSMRAALVLTCLLLIFFFIKYLFMPFLPMILAVAISYAINPVVTFLESRLKFPRPIAVFMILLFFFSLFSGMMFLIIAELVHGTAYLAERIPAAYQAVLNSLKEFLNTTILPLYNHLLSFIHTLDPAYQTAIHEKVEQYITQLTESGSSLLKDLFLGIPGVIGKLPNSITAFIFTVLGTFFLANDWPRISNFTSHLLPVRFQQSMAEVVWHLKKALTGYVRAQFIMVLITFLLLLTGLTVLEVKHSLTISLIVAALDLLPYIGTGIIFLPWIFYLFFTGQYPLTLGLCTLYMLILITRQLLEPKILSGSIGLNPLVTLIVLFVSIQLWGAAGIVIAPLALLAGAAIHQAGVTRKIWTFIKG
ncbi:sporulation integral membrane protein YtvI [Virgibacillus xinjiangensis]|uniref:Sporulation integral membrane protein YtvI n=1 Tax=Virgibacillus xinjiangensis TaxID=393090 RepID=A0ABV7CUX5_9BACI